MTIGGSDTGVGVGAVIASRTCSPNRINSWGSISFAGSPPALADARWLGKLLEPLSDEQIRDCFRASGYSAEDIEANAAMVKERIKDLNRL